MYNPGFGVSVGGVSDGPLVGLKHIIAGLWLDGYIAFQTDPLWG